VWSNRYWRDYVGTIGGGVGHAVQSACVRLPQAAFCYSRLHRDRLLEEGLRSAPTLLEGMYHGDDRTIPTPNQAEPLVVFAGRHIREKRAAAIPPAVATARRTVPVLRGLVFGDGPERPNVELAIAQAGAGQFVTAPGFAEPGMLDRTLRTALCMLLPSSREGYGMVVVEASSKGTPSIVVRGEDNAAVELVEDGVNGVIAPSAEPDELARAILRVHAGGRALRESTCAWFAENARRLSLEQSLSQVAETYRRWASARL
jgi:glycosyltransferase involved in cell wall biosynthesis